jgi:hypothetical protein
MLLKAAASCFRHPAAAAAATTTNNSNNNNNNNNNNPDFKGRSRSSPVGIATRLRAGRSGFRIPVGARDFSLLQSVRNHSGVLFRGKATGA